MRTVLKSSRRVSVLKSDLDAIIHRGTLGISKKALPRDLSSADDLEEDAEMKCKLLRSCLVATFVWLPWPS